MTEQELARIWDQVEHRWPAVVGGQKVGFAVLRQQMHDFLARKSVAVRKFSHFGVVVSDMDASLELLAKLAGQRPQEMIQDWVAVYEVHVARTKLEGTELELIAPAGDSFFAEFLKNHGEGLHHLSCRAADIDACLETLRMKGVDLVDEEARSGSHGKIAFLKPKEFEPLYLELCQPVDEF